MSKSFDLIHFFRHYLPKNHWFRWICNDREYSNKQEWYKCQTCSFKDDEVVCKICIETCHKNHFVNYYGVTNGYCDCGAEVAGPCHALDKRGMFLFHFFFPDSLLFHLA